MKKLVQAAILIMGICSGSSIQSSQQFAPQNSSSPFTLIKLDHRTHCPECNKPKLIVPCYACVQKYRLPKPQEQVIPDHEKHEIVKQVEKRLRDQLSKMNHEQAKRNIEAEVEKEIEKARSYFKPGVVVATIEFTRNDAFEFPENCLNGDAERAIENDAQKLTHLDISYAHKERIEYIKLMKEKLRNKKPLEAADSEAQTRASDIALPEDEQHRTEERARKKEIEQAIKDLIKQEQNIREKVKDEIRARLECFNPGKKINDYDLLASMQQAALMISRNLEAEEREKIEVARKALNKWRRMPGVSERILDLAVQAHNAQAKQEQEQPDTSRIQARLKRQNSRRLKYATPTNSNTLELPVPIVTHRQSNSETSNGRLSGSGKHTAQLSAVPNLVLPFSSEAQASGELTAHTIGSPSHSVGDTVSSLNHFASPTARSHSQGSTRSIRSLDSARSKVTDGTNRSTGSRVAMKAILEDDRDIELGASGESKPVSRINLIVGSQTVGTHAHASASLNSAQKQAATEKLKTPSNGGKVSSVVPVVSANANGESAETAHKYRVLPGSPTGYQGSEQAANGCCAGGSCIIA